MMKTIWQYNLDVTHRQTIMMPDDSEFLHVEVHNNRPVLWVMVGTSNIMVEKTFITLGSEQSFDSKNIAKYVGTYRLEFADLKNRRYGEYVGHIFVEED
jgi:hypothetical protein